MPSFLTPDFGLLFWMLVAFLVVFFILAKFGFPAIINMVEERKKFIDESLKSAREANEKLSHVKTESDEILKNAHAQHAQIIKEAQQMRDKIIGEAKVKATSEGARMIEEAHMQIEADRQKAERANKETIVNLSVKIAGKVISKHLETEEKQEEWINELLSEVATNQ